MAHSSLIEDTASISTPDGMLAELTRLLYRQQQHLLHAPPECERRLRTSELERTKAERNLEYARSLLTKLEQDAMQIKAPAKRAEMQTLLNTNRDKLETILDRLRDLQHMAIEDDGSSDEEDLLGDVMDTPDESTDSALPSNDSQEEQSAIKTVHDSVAIPEPAAAVAPPPPPPPPATQTSQTLRARPSTAQSAAHSLSSPESHTTARAALFANRRKPAEPQLSTATAEAILDQQRAEQDSLSESILKIASALKASSQRFSTTLDADKDVLNRAGEGISKTEQSMDAARGRMGALRRMTEGKGWWGRMMLYAWVYGLMVSLVLLVFVMPKLRF